MLNKNANYFPLNYDICILCVCMVLVWCSHSEAHISTKPPLAPVLPRQAWKSDPSPRNTTPVVGGQPLDTGRTIESHKTKSSKKDELAEEWSVRTYLDVRLLLILIFLTIELKKSKADDCECRGFKDAKTAELMVRRAQKLKYNSDRHHKISKLGKCGSLLVYQLSCIAALCDSYCKNLCSSAVVNDVPISYVDLVVCTTDAQQRLAFFKKLELAQQRPPPAVAPQRKPRIQRVDYFQGFSLLSI